jgi:hypothetical protein
MMHRVNIHAYREYMELYHELRESLMGEMTIADAEGNSALYRGALDKLIMLDSINYRVNKIFRSDKKEHDKEEVSNAFQ